ncbi:arsenic resistance N-acetyltransferase ArsN2 [Endothiovibrio diazotrophicus]
MKIEPLDSIELATGVVGACGLPVDDLGDMPHGAFFGVFENGALVAVIGTELFGEVGLLRSLAVVPAHRGGGLGGALVDHAEGFASGCGVERLYLLTTTAEGYFLRRGYARAARDGAPEAIKATAQFSGLCPASSSLLVKPLKP